MRYLSSLEHTQGNTSFSGLCLIGCLPIAGAILWWMRSGFSPNVLLIIAAGVALSILIAKLSKGTVTTSPEGITFKKRFSRQFIAWNDVADAETESYKNHELIIIRGSRTTIKLQLPIDLLNERVEASIWQHLHRYGKTANYTPSDEVLSMWAEIPDDIPQEMDYYHGEVKHVSPEVRHQLREDYISQDFLNLSRDELRRMGQACNPCVIKWSDVADLSWDTDYDFLYLNIKSKSGDTITIQDWPCDSSDETDLESARFILAIIRRARGLDSQPAILIPEHIRKAFEIRI